MGKVQSMLLSREHEDTHSVQNIELDTAMVALPSGNFNAVFRLDGLLQGVRIRSITRKKKRCAYIESIHIPCVSFRETKEASDVITHDQTHEVSAANG